eukprot:scaffold110674_cov118-Phaeocystis_antarctica.AAC.3
MGWTRLWRERSRRARISSVESRRRCSCCVSSRSSSISSFQSPPSQYCSTARFASALAPRNWWSRPS